jgi:hypothetical protein
MPLLRDKWASDSKILPLTDQHRQVYQLMHLDCWLHLQEFPNLVSGDSFNDKIQWLKLFGQQSRMVELTDKLGLKKFVQQKLGAGYTPQTFQVVDTFDDFRFDGLPSSFVLKANHDCGSVYLVPNSDRFPRKRYKQYLTRALQQPFGCQGGSWQYWGIKKRMYAEEMLPLVDGTPPPDYKFHCSHGRVQWLQFIFDRGRRTREVIVDRDGRMMGVHFDQFMEPAMAFEAPETWSEMIRIAETLSVDFQYVRVDLYDIEGRIVVGELTFTPMNGRYQSEGNTVLGRMLTLNRSDIREPVSARYKVCRSLWG